MPCVRRRSSVRSLSRCLPLRLPGLKTNPTSSRWAKIAALAKSAGLTPEVVKAKLTEFLPAIIDRLTPNGAVKA